MLPLSIALYPTSAVCQQVKHETLEKTYGVLIDVCKSSDGLKSTGWDEPLFGSLLPFDMFELYLVRFIASANRIPCDYFRAPDLVFE